MADTHDVRSHLRVRVLGALRPIAAVVDWGKQRRTWGGLLRNEDRTTEPSRLLRTIRSQKNKNYGVDFEKREECDLVKSGIIDSSRVIKLFLTQSYAAPNLISNPSRHDIHFLLGHESLATKNTRRHEKEFELGSLCLFVFFVATLPNR